MSNHACAPPRPSGRPLRGVIEVHAGIRSGERDERLSRRWQVQAPDLHALRHDLADAMTIAMYYAGVELPFPQRLNWVTITCHWY